jgi:hypothetical protein
MKLKVDGESERANGKGPPPVSLLPTASAYPAVFGSTPHLPLLPTYHKPSICLHPGNVICSLHQLSWSTRNLGVRL